MPWEVFSRTNNVCAFAYGGVCVWAAVSECAYSTITGNRTLKLRGNEKKRNDPYTSVCVCPHTCSYITAQRSTFDNPGTDQCFTSLVW